MDNLSGVKVLRLNTGEMIFKWSPMVEGKLWYFLSFYQCYCSFCKQAFSQNHGRKITLSPLNI